MFVRSLLLFSGILLSGGCAQFHAGVESKPWRFQFDGANELLSGYVTPFGALKPWSEASDDLLTIGSPDQGKRQEVMTFDLWPLAGAGIGPVGLRLRVLTFEAAIGSLIYAPKAAYHPWFDETPTTDPQLEINRTLSTMPAAAGMIPALSVP
jgi:hypothetical protein